MMKRLFIVMMAVISAAGLYAQTIDESEILMDGGDDASYRISIGPKAGVNMAFMNGLQDEFRLNPSSSIGFQGGVAANFHFGRRTSKADGGTGLWGVQVEALYSQRTIKTDYDDLKFGCLEIPVLAQYYILPSLCIEAGPTFVTTFSSSPDEIFIQNFEETNTAITDLTLKTGEIKAFDVMASIGIGYKHHSGFTASARYNLGMSELAGNFTGKVSTISVSIGWLFNVVK